MGFALVVGISRHDHPPGRTLHAARQSRPGSDSSFAISAADHSSGRRQSPPGSASGFVIAAPGGENDYPPACRPPPGFQSGFFVIAATDEFDHASGRRPPPGSQSGFVIAPVDDENDHPQLCRQTPPRSESDFVIAAPGGEHDYPPASCSPPVAARAASSSSAPQTNTTIPQGVALLLAPKAASSSALQTANVANFVQAPRAEEKHIASHVPRWGVWLAADLLESRAWALYRERLSRFASLIGDREPVVLFRQLAGMGRAKRYIIALADDDRAPLDKFCAKLTAAGSTCDVMRNEFGP